MYGLYLFLDQCKQLIPFHCKMQVTELASFMCCVSRKVIGSSFRDGIGEILINRHAMHTHIRWISSDRCNLGRHVVACMFSNLFAHILAPASNLQTTFGKKETLRNDMETQLG